MRKNRPVLLVIDDDPNIRMLLEFVLHKHYQVVTRDHGLSGIAWLSDGNMPDLIMVDLDMPELNGYHFLKHIRESGFFQHLPVVMLSGYEDPSVKARCLQAGANEYLLKPFNPERILTCIKAVLTKRDPAPFA